MKTTQPINEERDDIQALLRSGFSRLRQCRFWLLRIDEPQGAKAWLNRLLASGLVHSAGQIDTATNGALDLRESVAVAFSHAGLARLGFGECADFPFPTPFRSGMGSPVRAALLRDTDRAQWQWSDTGAATAPAAMQAHLLVVHYAQFAPDRDPRDEPFLSAFPAPGLAHGLTALAVDSCPSYLRPQPGGDTTGFEPFGFRDALAQPVVSDLRDASLPNDAAPPDAAATDREIAPGEFVLGHRNEYGELTYCPDVEGWAEAAANPRGARVRFGFNGSYLAVRQIVQFVEAFEKLHPEPSPPAVPGQPDQTAGAAATAARPPSVAEKMIGRRRDDAGTPLWWPKNSPSDVDDFRFRIADTPGFHCPRGAHIRRANPRDTLGHDLGSGVAASRLHRLLRRGRAFRGPNPACERPGEAPACGSEPARRAHCGQGIFFVACNADLDRQFEFVQQRWIADSAFGDLSNQTDPVLGAAAGAFSMPDQPRGRTEAGLGPFTQTVGGGYFFLPGLAALRFVCGAGPAQKRAAPTAAIASTAPSRTLAMR